MRKFRSVILALALSTIGFGASIAAADDATEPRAFDAYLEAAQAADVDGEERTFDAWVPAGQGLLVEVDLTTFEVTTSTVDPTFPLTGHDDHDPNCLVLEPGGEGGLTPGAPLHVQVGDEQPEDAAKCQDDDAIHTTGTDRMEFVTAGDEGAMFRLQRDFSQGWGWVWIECETGDAGANFAIGPYDDLQHIDCYINNYGDPTEWTAYEAYVENDNTAGLTYGSISYVS